MNNHFSITHKNIHIQVEGGETGSYVLKYPDGKFLVIDRDDNKGWVVEDRSGDYWTDEDILALGALVNKNDPEMKKEEDAR